MANDLSGEDPKQKGWHLPDWVREWAMKLLPWVIIAIITAGVKLYHDNIGNMKDISRNTWHNAQQDLRDDRIEGRQMRMEARQDRMEENDAEFHAEMREKMDRILKLYSRR